MKSCLLKCATLVLIFLLTGAGVTIAQSPEPEVTLLNRETYIPDIATFMQIGASRPAGYTWDGETVFFISSQSGSLQVYRLTPEGWPYQLTTFEDGLDFFTLSWGGELAIIGASIGGSEQSQLFLMDTRTGQLCQLTDKDARFRSVLWAKDDRSIIYNSTEENGRDFHIYRMDITTGEAVRIFGDSLELNGSMYPIDISQDGSRLIVARWNSNVDVELFLLDLNSLEWQRLTEDDKDVVYDYPTLMPDNKTILMLCNNNEDGITRLAKMKVGSPEIEFFRDNWVDPRWEIESLSISRDYKYMSVLINQDGYMKLKLREVESKKELPSPPLDGQLGGASFDKNGACLISFNGPTRAPDAWRWNPQTEELQQLTFSSYAGIDREMFSDPELVHFKSFDSLEIPAFLYLPPNYEAGTPIPFIVHAHGGPSSQFTPSFRRNVQYLILNGYGVLAPNPRGSSGYGLEYSSLDDYKLRKNSLKDYKAAVDWLIANNYSQDGMVGIRGASYGGYVVLGMITEYPDLFSAAVDVVGIANYETFLKNTKAYRRANREAEYGPLSDPEFLAEISPIHKASSIKTPLLVIHGENDPRVPVSEARQIIQAMKDNNMPVDSLIFPDEGHGATKTVNVIAEYRSQVDFFNKHLKKTVEPPVPVPSE